MSGEGTGGGGALAVLLGLWIVAVAFIAGDRLQEEPVGGEPADIVEPAEVASAPEAEATPEPRLRECTSVKECDVAVTRADLARIFARAFELPLTTVDFFDDDDGLVAEAHINRMAAAGITSGCGEREFCPDLLVTRGELATFLGRAVEVPQADVAPFADVEGLVHADAINRLAAAGILEGCAADAYCPDEPITRGQLNAVLTRALEVADPVA